jgi:GT2 family glycosyltransferase
MNVSIVIPLYKPDVHLINEIDLALKRQIYRGKTQIIKINEGLGLADSINRGIKKAKYPIIVTLHQDCVPSSRNWLNNLISPFSKKEVVAAVSKVYLPQNIWNKFDFVSKTLSSKEQKVITPLLDEKGCAYRKSALISAGLFDGKRFRTAGEDFDMYLKLKKIGEIEYPDAKVIHHHYYTWKKRLKKELQLANGFGSLVRIYGREMIRWNVGLVKSIPLIGLPVFIFSVDFKRLKSKFLLVIPLLLLVHIIYVYGFWKGFINGKQTV